MKKIILLIAALSLVLTNCGGATTSKGIACVNSTNNHPAWGQVVYTLPICWVSQQSGEQSLILTSEENGATVSFQKTSPETQNLNTETFPLSTGETLYVTPSSPDDSDTKTILRSIKITSFNVAPSSCDAPNGDYAYSLNYTWQGITFGLPFCWGAEESHALGGDPQLMIYKKEDNGQYLRINFWPTNPLDDHYVKMEDTKLSGISAEKYSNQADKNDTDTSTVYVLATTPVWYIETNAPDDYGIQELLNTMSIVPVTFPTQE